MELSDKIITTPPRDAATTVILRDGTSGLEVFLVKRHGLSDVLGGAYVFPGGKLDAADAAVGPDQLDQTAAPMHTALAEPGLDEVTARSLFVAAAREALEESGVLFALSAQPGQGQEAQAMLKSGQGFGAVLGQLGLRLHTEALLPWSRWITPTNPGIVNKRFDTRFFVCALPAYQEARHDDHEATESAWLTPRAALEQYWSRDIELAPPQIMSLAHLARHANVASVLNAARTQAPPVIQPEPFDENGERILCYPGDPRHSVATRALPGPTRLAIRNRRFEPIEGFEALFL